MISSNPSNPGEPAPSPAHISAARLYVRYAPWQAGKRFLWRRLHWRDHSYTATTRFGQRMAGHSVDLVQGYIYYFGIWEPNLTTYITRTLAGLQGRTFVDVGANVGYFTLLASTLMPTGKVISIEAFPSIAQRLQRNIALNPGNTGNVRCVLCAATDLAGVITIYHAGQTNEGGTSTVERRGHGAAMQIPGMPMSDILSTDEVRNLRLMKIDVEGAETAVLRGLTSVMDAMPVDAEFIVEVSATKEGNGPEIFRFFQQRGFNAYLLENCYDAAYYIANPRPKAPSRIASPPPEHADIVWSRRDQASL